MLISRLFKKIDHQSAGFTLVEILVACGVIALLAIIGLVSFANYQVNSRDAKRFSDIKEIQGAIELYIQNNPQKLPPGVQANGGFQEGYQWSNLQSDLAPYLGGGQLPVDPRNQDGYAYMYCAEEHIYILATVLEKERDIKGDFDNYWNNPETYLSDHCIISDSSFATYLYCRDNADGEFSGQLGTIYGTVFCTGFGPEPILIPAG